MADEQININSLPTPVRNAIMAAFNATGCRDLYEDDAISYLKVIKESLEARERRVEVFRELTVRACGVFGYKVD